MLYRFVGETPEQFPTLVVTTETGEPRSAVLEPGDVVNVVSVDGEADGPVIHCRLEPADGRTAKASATNTPPEPAEQE